MNNRKFRKWLWLPLLLLIGNAYGQTKKPNVVLIFIDDMGWKDAGFTGSDWYETPNINALAKTGMVFDNAYAAAGNCAPSRACLISGMYTPRHGIYAVSSTKRGPEDKMLLEPVPNKNQLATSFKTVAEMMKENGYATAMFGKWHLGHDETGPAGQGFDVDGSFEPPSAEDFENDNDPKGIYKITNGACDFMERNKEKPFFLYVSHHATHMMIQAREEMYEKFEDKKEGEYQSHRKYAAMNAQMDDGVSILLKKIKSLGLEENTLVIFTSDNGGLPQSPQDPLRGFKGMYYEGGIRVPFIASWPGVIKPNSVAHTPIINQDLYATFRELAGGKGTTDGESLVKLFKGGKDLERKAIFWHFPGYLDKPNPGSRDQVFRSRPVTTVRKGDWKLLLYHEEWLGAAGKPKDTLNAVELYNLKNDIGEKHNLVSSHTTERDDLLKEVTQWLNTTKAPMPTALSASSNETKKKKKTVPLP